MTQKDWLIAIRAPRMGGVPLIRLVEELGGIDVAVSAGHEELKRAGLDDTTIAAFRNYDAGLLEINPLVITAAGELVALDAKVDLDDNALFRHPELSELRDASQEDEREHAAQVHGLNYIRLHGNIACMVNGAGLAMATMDLIKLHGGAPANFLDVGGAQRQTRWLKPSS